MKPLSLTLFALFAFVFAAFAQDTTTAAPAPTVTSLLGSLGGLINKDTPIPAHLFGAGVGLSQGSTLNGAVEICATKGLNMGCAVTRYTGGTSAGSAEGQQILLAQHGVLLHIHGQLGVAVGSDGSTGGNYNVGTGLTYNFSRLPVLKKHPGYWGTVTFDWDKKDVNEFVSQSGTVQGLKSAFRPFASRTSVTFWLQKEF